MIVPGLLAILVSMALLALIGFRDPKRLRNQHAHGERTSRAAMSRATRRLLGWLSLAPGVVLMLLGQWWAFLAWFGAVCTVGWLASHMLAIRTDTSIDADA